MKPPLPNTRNLFMKRNSLLLPVVFLFSVLTVSGQDLVTLDQVIGIALEKNYDVLLARNTSTGAALNDRYAPLAFAPQLNAVGSTVWNTNEQDLRFTDETRNNKGEARANNTTASLQLTWTLFDGTRMFATRERISQLAEQGELLVKDQMVNTVADVIVNYYSIVRQKQQLRAIQEQMSVSEERVKLAEKKLQVGTGVKPELLQAKIDYNVQRTQVLQQEALIEQLKEQLNALVGLQLPSKYDVADTIVIDLGLRDNDALLDVEKTNFGLQALKRNIDISNLSLRERRGEYFPMFNFNASYNYSKTDNILLLNPFAPLFNQSTGYNYGFSIAIPILNGFNARRQTQLAKLQMSTARYQFEQSRNTVNVQLKNTFINYDNARDILLIEEETTALARENVYIALESFKRGVTTFIELRTAQQSLEAAYNRLIAARFNAKLAETELLRLSGKLIQ